MSNEAQIEKLRYQTKTRAIVQTELNNSFFSFPILPFSLFFFFFLTHYYFIITNYYMLTRHLTNKILDIRLEEEKFYFPGETIKGNLDPSIFLETKKTDSKQPN
jgi:hypothetical protein